jgi:putative solute:sodium symporter small subunit
MREWDSPVRQHDMPLRQRRHPRGDAREKRQMSQNNVEAHWKKTSSLMWLMLGLWAFFSFFIHMFAPALNKISFIGFPLGFYMAAQGSLVAFVAMLFWFGKAQDNIDREFGMAEED